MRSKSNWERSRRRSRVGSSAIEKDGLLGLATIHPGQPPQKLTPQLRAKVLEKTRQAPPGRLYALVATQDGGGYEGQ